MQSQGKFAKLAVLVIVGSLLPSIATWARAESDAVRAIYVSGANVATNIPGIHTYVEPPKGFKPLTATDEELATYGFPPRPDKQAEPDHYALWQRAMKAAKIRWNGELRPLPGSGHRMIPSGSPRLPEVVQSQTGPQLITTINASGVMLTNKQTKWSNTNSFTGIYAEMSVPVAQVPFGASNIVNGEVTCFVEVSSAGIDARSPADTTGVIFPLLLGGVGASAGCETEATYYAVVGGPDFSGAFQVNPGDVFYTQVQAPGPNISTVYVEDITTQTYNSYTFDNLDVVGNAANWLVFRYYSDELLPLANTINIFFDYTFAETGNGKNFYPGSQASSTEILGMTDDGGDQGIEVVNQGSGGFEGQHALEFFTTGCAYSGGCTP
ncbi:MAG: G1 family glutamic endopeptidase [Terriglobales bacterium]